MSESSDISGSLLVKRELAVYDAAVRGVGLELLLIYQVTVLNRVHPGLAEGSCRQLMTATPVGPPARAAWHAAGAPVADIVDPAATGWCGCCGTDTLLAPAASVVSSRFTDICLWNYGHHWLCAACAWAYMNVHLRRTVYIVDQTPAARSEVSRTDLGAQLATRVLRSDQAVVLPVRGRRHILPTATWGHVCVDDTHLRWDHQSMDLLGGLRRLRALPGMRASMLTDPAPPFSVLRTQPSHHWHTIIDTWAALEDWRHLSGAWWDAAIALSTPPASSETQ